MKPDGLVEVQWGQAQFRVCNPAGGLRIDWLQSSQLSSDINAFALKKKQKIYYSGLCGDGSVYMGG